MGVGTTTFMALERRARFRAYRCLTRRRRKGVSFSAPCWERAARFMGNPAFLGATPYQGLYAKPILFASPEIGIHKPLILLIVACGILRGFFHTNQVIVVFDRYGRRRRQLLWRHTLDLTPAIWPHDVALDARYRYLNIEAGWPTPFYGARRRGSAAVDRRAC